MHPYWLRLYSIWVHNAGAVKARTLNRLPPSFIQDLRTDYEVGNVQGVIDGDLDGFMEAYLRWRRTEADADTN